jgi:AhpD family alkylhydroperoxidase
MGPGAVDRRTKELVYLVASFANECAYCSAAHRTSAKNVGITEEEIRAMETEQYQDFSEPERAAIQYARELTAEASADESGEALYRNFNDEQVIEITLVAAMANFTIRFNNGLGVQPEQ